MLGSLLLSSSPRRDVVCALRHAGILEDCIPMLTAGYE